MNLRNGAIVGATLLATAAFAFQATTMTLYQDGKIVSSDLKTIDGRLYVSVRDLTNYWGGTVASSGGRVDITTPAGQTPDVPAEGAAQALAQEPMANVVPPTTPLASANPPPPPLPDQLTAGMNGEVSFGGFSYTVTAVKYEDRLYRQQFDQRGTKLHPQWKTDRLAIVYLTVKNTGSQPGEPSVPGSGAFTVFDSNNIGYAASDLDIRQEPQVVGDATDYGFAYGMDFGTPETIIAPGGQIAYAVVGSIPKQATVKMVQFHISPPSIPGQNMAPPVNNPPTPPATTPGATPEPPTNGTTINPSGADVTIHM